MMTHFSVECLSVFLCLCLTDIGDMGRRLALELSAYFTDSFSGPPSDAQHHLGRLSFLCHSLGGLIVRSALNEPPLAPYLPKLFTYVSLATPHCGYVFGSENILLNTGIWFLKKWNKSKCLAQLSMTDEPNEENNNQQPASASSAENSGGNSAGKIAPSSTPPPSHSHSASSDAYDSDDDSDSKRHCFLYRLSRQHPTCTLSHFTHLYLFASHLDKYAPFHSARIEISPQAIVDRKKGGVFHQMIASMLGSMQVKGEAMDFRRFDVWFAPMKKNGKLDNFIGRTAHINFLTETNYMKLILQIYPHLFQ